MQENKQNNVKVRVFDVDKTEKVHETLTPFFENGEHKYRKKKITFKKIDRQWKKAKIEESIVSFAEVHKDLKDQVSLEVIIKRTAIDTEQVKNVFGFFLTKCTIKAIMPNTKLSISDNKVFLHTFDGDSVFCQNVNPLLSSRMYKTEIDQKMQRISTEEAIKKVKAGTMIFEENPNARTDRDRYRIATAYTGRKF